MTRSADEIDQRADRERAKEHRSYVEGIQLGNEAILKALLSSVIAIYEPETATEKEKIINQIRNWAVRSLPSVRYDSNSGDDLEDLVARSVIQAVFER
jgi:hypothetical protein